MELRKENGETPKHGVGLAIKWAERRGDTSYSYERPLEGFESQGGTSVPREIWKVC